MRAKEPFQPMKCHDIPLCRRCRSKQWRGHPADYYHHPCWWAHWDLQDDWQRGPGVDPSYWDAPSITYCSKDPLPYICNLTGFPFYITLPWNGINNPLCLEPSCPVVSDLLPATNLQLCGFFHATLLLKSPLYPWILYIINAFISPFHFIVDSFFTFHTIFTLSCDCKCCTTLL